MQRWIETALANRHNTEAVLRFANSFLSASRDEQQKVVAGWNSTLVWALPSPWRLACDTEVPGSKEQRIETTLLFQALAMHALDARDTTVSLAIIFNSAKLAGIEPIALFERIARCVGGRAAEILAAFVFRPPEAQSLEAFLLEPVPDPQGGYELRIR